MRSRFFFALLLAAVGAGAYAVYEGRLAIPDRLNPWAPLTIEEPLNWVTRLKLLRISRDGARCMAALEQADMRYTPVPDRRTGDGCGLENAVRVSRTSVEVEPFTLSCRSAVSLAMWERHVLAPAAETHFGEPLARIEHAGTYACRNIYARKDAPLSRHATADAIDVTGFVLQDGRRISVARAWGATSPEGRFLRDAHAGACRLFDSVLGPDYNAAHGNHFHLDRGGFHVCR